MSKQVHPYTEALLSAILQPKLKRTLERIVIRGELTSPIDVGPGCRFAPRCPHAREECFHNTPELKEISPSHFAASYFPRRG